MEKIFDIAKDSEKSWGVIAQGIDGNFEEVVDNVNKIEGVDALDNLLKTRCPLILGYIGANGSINPLNLKYCRTDFIGLDANGRFKIEFSNDNQKLYRVASYSGNDKEFVKLIDNYIFEDGILTFDKDDTMLTEIGKTTSCRLVIDNNNYPDDADTNLVDISNAHETNDGVYIGEMQYYGAQTNPKAISGLIECCATINYKDGHYIAGDSGLTQTQTLRENIQFEYNMLMRFIAAASKY